MTEPRVRIVVLNYNGAPFVHRCLEHVLALDWPADRLEVVVVDNASTDGSPEEIVARFGTRVRLVANAANTGFPANNLGFDRLDDVDFVGLVNPDAFVEPAWLSHLVAGFAPGERVGATCPKIVLEPAFIDLEIRTDAFGAAGDPRSLGVRVSGVEVDGADRYGSTSFGDGFWGAEAGEGVEDRFQWTADRAVLGVPVEPGSTHADVRLRIATTDRRTVHLGPDAVVEVGETPEWVAVTVTGRSHDIVNNAGSRLVDGGFGGDRGFLEPDRGQYDQPQDVFAWCGGGVLLSRAYLEDVGGFDERFFLYYEDTDMAWRGLARGWRHRYVPAAKMRHIHSASTTEGSPMFQHYVERNRLVMLTKNAPGWLLRRAVVGYVRALASFTRRDVVLPIVRGRRPTFGLVKRRARSLVAYLRMVPHLLADRRRLRRSQSVPDAVITGWAEPQ